MKRDDVIRMAQECNLIGMRPHLDGIYQESIERFAALVAAAAKAEENEVCANIAEANAIDREDEYVCDKIVAAIRARRNT